MKLSDKALRRIGCNLLGSMDETTHQDETHNTANTALAEASPRACNDRVVNLRGDAGKRTAAVLPFRAGRPEG